MRVENDASLAAVAERAAGAAVGCDDFVVLLAGERLGAGVAVDGRILRGAHGGVGEMVAFDHVTGVGGAWGLGYRAAQWAREAVAQGEVDRGPSPGADSGPRSSTGATCSSSRHPATPTPCGSLERVGETLAVIAGIFGSLFDPRSVIVSGAVADGIGPVIEAARRALPDELDLPAPEIARLVARRGRRLHRSGGRALSRRPGDGVLDLTRPQRRAGA